MFVEIVAAGVLKGVNFDEMSWNAVQVVHKFLTEFSKKFST